MSEYEYEWKLECKAGFTSERKREQHMWKRGEAECMVHLYTVQHSPRHRIDPT